MIFCKTQKNQATPRVTPSFTFSQSKCYGTIRGNKTGEYYKKYPNEI